MTALLILRHEEADPGHDEGDALRGLTARGRTRMLQQARALFEALPGIDVVYTSPLVRAIQTAEILVSAFDAATPVVATRIVSDPPSLESLVELGRRTPAPLGVVALVGHEPTLSTLVEHLLGGHHPGFRTGQAVLITPVGSGWTLSGGWRGGLPLE